MPAGAGWGSPFPSRSAPASWSQSPGACTCETDMSQEVQEIDEAEVGQALRENLFTGDLIQLPAPEQGIPDFLPSWYEGSLAALVYPPLGERGIQDGESIDLQITPYHLYYGALRELAETAE